MAILSADEMVAIRQAVGARIRLRNDWIVAFGCSRGGETSEEQTERQCIAVLDSHASLELHRDKLREALQLAYSEITGDYTKNNMAVLIPTVEKIKAIIAALALTAPSQPAETEAP